LVIPMLIHASYNFLVGVTDTLWFFVLLAAIFYARGLHQQISVLQKEKKFEAERKLV
jgi:RsiW-degrading membrane proteinase PrsW (M82 family)